MLFNQRLIEVGNMYCSCVQTSSIFLSVKSSSLFCTQQVDLSGELESSGHLPGVAWYTLPIFRVELSQEVGQTMYVCRTYQNGTTLDSRKQKIQKAHVAESKKIKICNTLDLLRDQKSIFSSRSTSIVPARNVRRFSIPTLRAAPVCTSIPS